jgi:sugar lactone lactonase YvrE
MDNAMLAQAVPTAVAFADDGTLYVSHLSGAPFVPGSAKVVKVNTKDVVKTSAAGEVSDFATGLTMLTDLKAAPDGNLYATQFAVFTQQGPQPNSGAVIRIRPDGSAETVIAGLPFVTAIAFSAAGEGFVAINGVGAPGSGQVVRYDDLLERTGSPLAQMGGPQN